MWGQCPGPEQRTRLKDSTGFDATSSELVSLGGLNKEPHGQRVPCESELCMRCKKAVLIWLVVLLGNMIWFILFQVGVLTQMEPRDLPPPFKISQHPLLK